MNKLLFDASGNVQGPISVAGHYQYEQDYEGKKSVLSFIKKGDSLKIPESQINFDGESDYLEFNFRMDTPPEAGTETDIVSGKAIPFTLSCFAGEKGLMLHTRLTTDSDGRKYLRESESATPLKYATWYNVKIVFIHDEYFLLIDDQPHLRRIYKGAWWEYAKQNLVFGGGEQTGLHVCDIAFSEDIFEESSSDSINAVFQQMNDDDFMEVDSCIRDCALDGIVLQGKASQVTIAGKACSVYPNGAIVFDYEDKAIYLPAEIFKYYASHVSLTGHPIAYTTYTCETDNNQIQFGLFEKMGIFYNVTSSALERLTGDTLRRFLNCDLQAYNFWYPSSCFIIPEPHLAPVDIHVSIFSNQLVIYEFEDKTIMLPLSFHLYLEKDCFRTTGLPVDDYRIGVDSNGEKCYEALECQNGTLHTTDTFENFFSDKKLGAPTKLDGWKDVPDQGTIHYYEFESGIIVMYPWRDEPVVHTGLEFRFTKVTAGPINDAINTTPELYMYFWAYLNGEAKEKKEKLGLRNYPAPTSYVWGNSHNNFTIPILRGNSSFRVRIRMYDYDPESPDDYIGAFDYTFNIENGWEIDNSDGPGGRNKSLQLDMTDEGKDNLNGPENCQLYMSVIDTYDLNEMLKDIPKNFAFPFYNFKGSYPFTYERFTTIFTNANKFTEFLPNTLLHPLDSLMYVICTIALLDAKCYGFAASEILATQRLGPFAPPLYNYTAPANYDGYYSTLDSEIADRICDYYLHQLGWDAIMWGWKKMNANEYLVAHNALPSIIKRLDDERVCLLCILPPNIIHGHAVMAYKYKKILPEERDADGYYKIGVKDGKEVRIKADYDYLIYIADCNWPLGKNRDSEKVYSFIAFEKKSKTKDLLKVCRISAAIPNTDSVLSEDAYEDYCYMYETPLSILTKAPRVPNVLDLSVGTFANMAIAWFSCAADTVQISDPVTGKTLYDSEKGVSDSSHLMVFGNIGGGENGHAGFLFEGNDINIQVKGAKEDELTLHVAGRGTNACFKTHLSKGERFGVTLGNIHRSKQFSAKIDPGAASRTVQTRIEFSNRHDLSLKDVYEKEIVAGERGAKLESFIAGARLRVNNDTVRPAHERIEIPDSRIQKIAMRRNYPGAVVWNRNLTTRQIKGLFRISMRTARVYCKNGLLPGATKVRNRWSAPSEDNAMQ